MIFQYNYIKLKNANFLPFMRIKYLNITDKFFFIKICSLTLPSLSCCSVIIYFIVFISTTTQCPLFVMESALSNSLKRFVYKQLFSNSISVCFLKALFKSRFPPSERKSRKQELIESVQLNIAQRYFAELLR